METLGTVVHNGTSFSSRFPDLFAAIEGDIALSKEVDNALALGIDSYGVSMTTLEEIFLKLGEEEENEEQRKKEKNKGNKWRKSKNNIVSTKKTLL